MIWGEEKRLCLLYALTPVHAGSGQALRAVDLPIQRERHTGIPIVQASGIKGSIRDWCEKAWKNATKELADEIFGKAGETGSNWAGAVTVTDARLLLFPVRSNIAPFVHVTSPSVLKRFKKDMELVGRNKIPDINNLEQSEVYVPLIGNFESIDSVILEDIVVKKANSLNDNDWENELQNIMPDLKNTKAILVADEVFGYLVRMATEVQAHIAIDDATGTAKDGSLRYQEYLPSDSVLYFIAFFSDVRAKNGIRASEVASKVTEQGVSSHIQIGGDFTLGKGICKVIWIKPS